MDMNLPVMSGWDAAAALNDDLGTRCIPVIGLTANAMSTDRDKVFQAGCDDYDTKPVELARLLKKIDALLAKSRCGNSQG
jgi:two-component system cell cycle response regulator DivK